MMYKLPKINIENLKKPETLKKALRFSVFLLIAIIFWFLNALDKEYTTEIEYPVELYNIPNNKTLITNFSDKITVKLSAYGFDIIGKLKTKMDKNIRINVKKLSLKKAGTNNFFVLTSSLLKQINGELGVNMKIHDIYPDSLIFILSDVISKKVKLNPQVEIKFAKTFMQISEIQVIPDSVVISGLKDSIENIISIKTEISKFNDVKDSIIEEINIEKSTKYRLHKEKAKIIIPIEKYTEKKLDLALKINNLPDSVKIIFFPNKIIAKFKIGLSSYNKISENNFDISLDYNDLIKLDDNKVELKLNEFPKQAKSIQLQPKTVEFIIEKNE